MHTPFGGRTFACDYAITHHAESLGGAVTARDRSRFDRADCFGSIEQGSHEHYFSIFFGVQHFHTRRKRPVKIRKLPQRPFDRRPFDAMAMIRVRTCLTGEVIIPISGTNGAPAATAIVLPHRREPEQDARSPGCRKNSDLFRAPVHIRCFGPYTWMKTCPALESMR
jgi:hypothetical protein